MLPLTVLLTAYLGNYVLAAPVFGNNSLVAAHSDLDVPQRNPEDNLNKDKFLSTDVDAKNRDGFTSTSQMDPNLDMSGPGSGSGGHVIRPNAGNQQHNQRYNGTSVGGGDRLCRITDRQREDLIASSDTIWEELAADLGNGPLTTVLQRLAKNKLLGKLVIMATLKVLPKVVSDGGMFELLLKAYEGDMDVKHCLMADVRKSKCLRPTYQQAEKISKSLEKALGQCLARRLTRTVLALANSKTLASLLNALKMGKVISPVVKLVPQLVAPIAKGFDTKSLLVDKVSLLEGSQRNPIYNQVLQ
ncbi:hypothetical protein NQ176_g8027 [Zarea fungicola]|uniref:Uncharacterized protein n=1 Tax=Zarea fungicola TaxID=93591 RepID=A0ACC1MVK1_9HYPO|nr:hypothetical protein NQ176_g8027 [Lecanicillium fungicola]